MASYTASSHHRRTTQFLTVLLSPLASATASPHLLSSALAFAIPPAQIASTSTWGGGGRRIRVRGALPIVSARDGTFHRGGGGCGRLFNLYDDWRSDTLQPGDYGDFSSLPLDEEFVEQCLEEFVDSDYGKQMFGKHDLSASVGITGEIEFVSLDGPEVILVLTGKFWHRRETVLGRAAMYLNARIPELTTVSVSSPEELEDRVDVRDDITGELLYVEEKRSPDFNGDRGTMEYQGIDPDARGPFLRGGDGGMMIPA